jgi:hypothetical protein
MQERGVEIKKEDLIAKIKEHKKNHIEEFEEAAEIYKKEAAKALNKMKKDISNGNFDVHFQLRAPENRVDEYDKILTQLEWEQRNVLTLSQYEFNQYVLDEYNWRQQASMSNSFYLNMK